MDELVGLSWLTYQQLVKEEEKIRKYRHEYITKEWANVIARCPQIQLVNKKNWTEYEKRGVISVTTYYDPPDHCFYLRFDIIQGNEYSIPVCYTFTFSDVQQIVTVQIKKITPKGIRKNKEKILSNREEILDYIGQTIPLSSEENVGTVLLHYWDNNVFWGDGPSPEPPRTEACM